jgi:hypothetical protein
VTLFWCLNDAYSNIPLANLPGQNVRNMGGNVLAFAKRNLMLFQWVKSFVFDNSKSYYLYDSRLYSESTGHLSSALGDLIDVRDLCKDAGIPLDIVLLPYEFQLRKGSATHHPQNVMLRELAVINVPAHDVLENVDGGSHESSDFYLFNDGIHFSRKGHALIMDYLKEHLLNN